MMSSSGLLRAIVQDNHVHARISILETPYRTNLYCYQYCAEDYCKNQEVANGQLSILIFLNTH